MRDGAVLQAATISLTLLVPLVAGLWVNGDPEARNIAYWLHPMADDARLAQADIAFLRARRGDAVCESLALCYWAGSGAHSRRLQCRRGVLAPAHAAMPISSAALSGTAPTPQWEFDSLRQPFALTPRA